jgi:phage baseplate assembly protein gpV
VEGVRTARVVDNIDPEGRGRLLIGTKGDRSTAVWARTATLAAGDGRGTWFRPAIDDQVLVAYVAGDPTRPVIIGALWSSGDEPPESGPQQAERTTIRTRSGAVIRIEDPPAPAPATITIETGSGESIRVGPIGIEVSSTGAIDIAASGPITVRAPSLDINTSTIETTAAIARFGVVQCETLIANSVVAASYSPGAGNMM